MTRSAIEVLADLAQPRAYWIELLTRAGERGLEIQRTSISASGDLKSARQRCRYMMEGALRGRHPRGISRKKLIDKLVAKLVAAYRERHHDEIVAFRTRHDGERSCRRSYCSTCTPRSSPAYLDYYARRAKQRAEIRKERRKRRKRKKQRARSKKERRKRR